MSWLIDGKTFARKVKNPAYGICREASRRVQLECPSCGHDFQENEGWPGFPPGVKFDPSDQEILEHLAAQVGVGAAKPHPFINEFIPTIDVDGGICYTHPEKLPGIRRDGSSTHFFCVPPKAYQTGSRKRRKVQKSEENGGFEVRWHKTGKTRPIIENGNQLGCKKIMVLYTNNGKKEKPHKTNWVMHQYHLGMGEEEEEGQLVVSKVFYQTQPRQSNRLNDDDDEDLVQPDFDMSQRLKNSEQTDLEVLDALRNYTEQTDFKLRMSDNLSGESMFPEVGTAVMKDRGAHEMKDRGAHESEVSNDGSPAKVTAADLVGKTETVENDDRSNDVPNEIECDAASGEQLSQEAHSSISGSQLSQLLSGSLDAELLKFLSNESMKPAGEANVMDGLKSFIAEASSKLDSQEGCSLDKLFLGTPPEFLESLLANSQGEDWLEKLKFFSDSQKTDDFSLSQFLQSQSQQ